MKYLQMIPWWFWLWLVFISLFAFLLYWTKKLNNPYKLYMVFGRKGSGKSTYMQKLAYQYWKKGRQVFSNTDMMYCTKININMLGHYVPPYNSVLLIDEVGMIWDNRNFKNFRTDVRDYFKYQRHHKNIVYLFSQTFDVDVKLRVLTDAMYLVTRPLPPISCIRKIKRTIVLVQPSPDAEGRIADSLEFVPWWLSIFGAKTVQFLWLPKWIEKFDSFQHDDLPQFPSDSSISPYSKAKRRAALPLVAKNGKRCLKVWKKFIADLQEMQKGKWL